MNLIDRIQSRLDDDGHRLQSGDFEDCATELIGRLYPGLAPIPGGTDHGLDAELVRPNGHVLGLVVTSSRSWDGAKKSLRGSLKSAREHGRKLEHVMVANLAEVNQTKRLQLAKIANEFDCDLMQVFDRAWFANEFLRSPDWRLKVLGISGGFSSFSRTARGARPEETQLSTIGRDELLATAAATDHDLVIWGVPGAGKSHVAGKLPGALFLAEHALPEQLVDDLISTTPDVVVVDDAGARAADVQRLWGAREAENLDFRIVATCWPHEVGAVGDALPGATSCEVDLLTREELGAILRERGVTRTAVLAHILDQAQGRPAWAINLADLLVDRRDWQSVWSGRALRQQILSFLRRSNAEDEAIHLLATVALAGGVNERQMRELGKLFELTPTRRAGLTRSVAIAGLLDVQRRSTWEGDGPTVEEFYRVVPPVVAASIASDVYFAASAPAISIRDIKEALPELSPHVVQSQIHAALLGADEPLIPTEVEFISALEGTSESSERMELLRTYALIGPRYANIVDGHLAKGVASAVATGQAAIALSQLVELAHRTAEALQRDDNTSTGQLFEAFVLVIGQGWDCSAAVKALVEGVRAAPPGEWPSPDPITRLAMAISGPQCSELPRQVWLELAVEILTPTVDGNYKDPESSARWVLQSFTWPAHVLTELFDLLRTSLAGRAEQADVTQLRQLIMLLEKFVGLAAGRQLPFGGLPTEEQRSAGAEIARALAADVGRQISTPGLRTVFNRAVGEVAAPLNEPDDLFRALTREHDFGCGWEEDQRRHAESVDAALAAYLVRPAETLMAWLEGHQQDLSMVSGAAALHLVFARLAAEPNPTEWLRAALDHGLGRVAGPVIRKCLDLGLMTEALSRRMLADRGARTAFVPAVIADCHDQSLVDMVVEDLSGEDLASLEWGAPLGNAGASTLALLFQHPSPQVRSGTAVLWAADRLMGRKDAVLDAEWAEAMEALDVDQDAPHNWAQNEALKALARVAPESFMDLMVRHVVSPDSMGSYDVWKDSAAELSVHNRQAVWRRVRDSPRAANAFWVLACDDTDWISKEVAEPGFPLSVGQLLHAMQFQFHVRLPLSDLARALRPMGWTPDDLLWTLEVGTGTGTEYERLAAHLETCAQLAASSDADLAALGARGVERYQPRVDKARAAARRAAVRGELGP
ncbi:hypothetical protein [Janibacter indicus]|uniref:Uncharacterized protein n=1 Tax=Janibacter indicus TaxID=857417 RepID=A0A1W1YS13_9MICO|nr:hypothetical protein [Janibacter indicus]SMC38987.1 hypothetical protein SAMN06296429_102322 [Janibacter indicus]